MVAVASTANLELDQLLNEASSEDGEDSHESANLEDILASDDGNASEDEAVSRVDRRTSSEADRLLALILNEEDEGGGVTLTPPESQAEAALLSPGRRQAELHALLRRADETLGADAEPDAAASPLRMPEAPPATAAPLAPHQRASEGSRGPRCGGTGDDGGTAAAAASASPVAAPVMLASGLTASEARTVAERAAAAAAAAATATDAARGGVALAEAAEVRPSPSPSPSPSLSPSPSPSPNPRPSTSPSPSPNR